MCNSSDYSADAHIINRTNVLNSHLDKVVGGEEGVMAQTHLGESSQHQVCMHFPNKHPPPPLSLSLLPIKASSNGCFQTCVAQSVPFCNILDIFFFFFKIFQMRTPSKFGDKQETSRPVGCDTAMTQESTSPAREGVAAAGVYIGERRPLSIAH